MGNEFTPEQIAADDAQYAALAAELDSEESPWDNTPSPADEAHAPSTAPREAAEAASDEDGERQRRIDDAAATADEVWSQYLEAQRQQAGQAPSIETDPLGYVQQMGAQLQQLQAHNQQQQLAQTVHAAEQQMRDTTPDYDAALQHMASSRIAELEMIMPDDDPRSWVYARQQLGPNATPAQLRAAVVRNDAQQLIQAALSRGQSPAKFAYDMAVKKGYQSAIQTTRRGQRASADHARSTHKPSGRVMNAKQLTALYETDPEAFDAEWDRWAAAQR